MATILIAGANRGIGLELARQYAREGHDVIRCIRGADKAGGAIGEVQPLDVTDDASVAALAQALAGRPIDLVIASAGVIGPEAQSATEMDFPGFLATLDTNVLGPLRVVQALLPNVRAAGHGRVAVISSQMGSFQSTHPNFIAYRASKAAVNKVFQCLAGAFREDGIAVVALHPGWVRTDMGGPGADISVETSAAGIRKVLDDLDLGRTGRFYAYDGTELEW